ncbi:MAG TPA: multicopper oxidase domain-containing protein [Gemmatimonadales bacterium]|nr:multicopper oxidase domain-containing protein [Gemmatimonadales bacterium]
MRRLFFPLVLVAACKAPASGPASAPAATPATHAPADMSHGEAPVGLGTTPAPVSAVAPARSTTTRHKIRLEMKHARVVLTDGVAFDAWTFNGDVPGPALRVTVGDTIDFTLVNKAPIPHSMDFHAAEVAPSRAYVNVNPNDSLQYRWVARVPGAFMYHCGTAPVALHIASGMYGAIIVDPVRPRPASTCWCRASSTPSRRARPPTRRSARSTGRSSSPSPPTTWSSTGARPSMPPIRSRPGRTSWCGSTS